MTLTRPRVALLLAGGTLAVWAFLTAFLSHVAHAAGDPVATATATSSDGWDLVQQYGPIWGAALLVFGTLTKLLAVNESTHWIAQGRVLAILTGIGSVIAALLDWHFHGAQLAGVIVTIIMAIKLVWSPRVIVRVDPTPTPARDTQAGRITAGVALGLAVTAFVAAAAFSMAGCGTTQSQRTSTLSAALVTVDASREAFVAYDSIEQAQIVAKAASLDEGKAALTAYRAKRHTVEASFGAAYRAIAVALTLSDDPSFAGAKAALLQVLDAVSKFTGGSK